MTTNPLDLALQTELDGQKYYENQADATSDDQLKKVFEMLAKDEAEHYRVISELKQGQYANLSSETFKDVQTIFAKQLSCGEPFKAEVNNLEAYEQAIRFEDESVALYKELGAKAETDVERELFQVLVREELAHRIILQNLLEAIRRPQDWVENWEFNHLDEY